MRQRRVGVRVLTAFAQRDDVVDGRAVKVTTRQVFPYLALAEVADPSISLEQRHGIYQFYERLTLTRRLSRAVALVAARVWGSVEAPLGAVFLCLVSAPVGLATFDARLPRLALASSPTVMAGGYLARTPADIHRFPADAALALVLLPRGVFLARLHPPLLAQVRVTASLTALAPSMSPLWELEPAINAQMRCHFTPNAEAPHGSRVRGFLPAGSIAGFVVTLKVNQVWRNARLRGRGGVRSGDRDPYPR